MHAPLEEFVAPSEDKGGAHFWGGPVRTGSGRPKAPGRSPQLSRERSVGAVLMPSASAWRGWRLGQWLPLGLLLLVPGPAPLANGAEEPGLPVTASREVEFAADVEPILMNRCVGCHGASLPSNGLRLDEPLAALRGGNSGRAIVPHRSSESLLIQRVASLRNGFRMPPDGPGLSREEIGILRAWIDQGAAWEQKERPGREPERVDHWAFQPIRRPPVPDVTWDGWARNPIDRFVLARLEAEGLQPSPEAAKLTLLRRVTLDLIGLPPTTSEARDFLEDTRPGAYERAVNRLLDSKHYGEKWARDWLDLARYADSDGYTQDLDRPYAWRWRDWVIDALNSDLPFDEFTTLQLAADLLPRPTPGRMAALGFHRNTLRNREGGTIYEQSRFEETLDRANTVASTWLGLTLECAQCHDHKYDPITQRDYYSFFAFFDNVTDEHIDAPIPGEFGPYLQSRAEYRRKRQELLDEYGVPKLQPEWERQMKIAAARPGERTDWDLCYDVIYQMTDGGWETLYKEPSTRIYHEQEVLTDYFIDWYHTVVSKERTEELQFKDLRKKLEQLKAAYPQLTRARIIRERGDPGTTFLRFRGQWNRKGAEVRPGPPTFLEAPEGEARQTRLDLAKWILSQDNPLTARVVVNRMWQAFFGRGLTLTSEDFGTRGAEPSHPQLLDWLASEFRDGGWRIKRMHRLIVMSATYRQSSRTREDSSDQDPDNVLLSRQNRLRLTSEAVRDSALAASGLLAPEVGGPSVFPPLPDGVTDLTYQWDTERWPESQGPDRYRRGLYTFFRRTSPFPQMMIFDAPDSNRTASRRRRSNTPLQALNLLNDEVFLEAARALAVRILTEERGDWDERLEYAFQLTLSRSPVLRETAHLFETYRRQRDLLTQSPTDAGRLAGISLPGVDEAEIAAWMGVGRILMNTDEFITRE